MCPITLKTSTHKQRMLCTHLHGCGHTHWNKLTPTECYIHTRTWMWPYIGKNTHTHTQDVLHTCMDLDVTQQHAAVTGIWTQPSISNHTAFYNQHCWSTFAWIAWLFLNTWPQSYTQCKCPNNEISSVHLVGVPPTQRAIAGQEGRSLEMFVSANPNTHTGSK